MNIRSKRTLTVFLSAVILFAALPLSSSAAEIVASGEVGEIGENISWTVSSDGVLTISGTGATKDYTSSENSPFSIVDKVGDVWITEIVIEPGVTRLGDYLFYYVPHVERVTIPDTVESIGRRALSNCDHLNNVIVPDSVTSIDVGAFSACGALEQITLSKSISSIPSGLLSSTPIHSVVIPAGVTEINSAAFVSCIYLSEVTIPDSVASVGMQAFHRCTNLKYLFYSGTEEQWQSISVGTYNTALTSSQVIMHYNATGHTPVLSEKRNEDPATCSKGKSYDRIDVCAVEGCDYVSPEYRFTESEVDESNHVNTVEFAETDSTYTDHGYTAGVYCNDCEKFISGHEEKPLLVPDESVTEPEEPTTESEEPTTEPVSEPEPTAPTTDPTTNPTTEPTTEPMTVPAAPTGAIHGARCFCYNYTGNGLLANIVRFICATYSFLWNLRDAIG